MLIPLQLTFRNMPHSEGLEQLVRSEVDKLERYFDRITSCRVVVERPERATSAKQFHVRIDLGVPTHKLVVKHMPSLHGMLRQLTTERSRVEPDATYDHKHPERAIREAFHEMRRRLQDEVRELPGDKETPSNAPPRGEVKVLFADEGFGFIETSDGRQIYFNQASVLDDAFSKLRPGMAVRFVEEAGEKGPQATTVEIIHPRRAARLTASTVPLRPKAAKAG